MQPDVDHPVGVPSVVSAAMHPGARLAIVLSHPTQYYSPWFRWLATHTDLTFRVFYLWDFGITPQRDPQFETTLAWDTDLLSGYDHEFVPNTARVPGTQHFNGLRNPTLTARLGAWNPSTILMFGYKWRSHLAALLWARFHRIPVLFRGDSHFLGRSGPGPATALALRALYAQYAAFLPVGIANEQYFRRLGVPSRKLFRAPHSVDAAHFDPESPQVQAAARALRTELGIASATRVVLFAGKLIPAKQPRELLHAFLSLALPQTALVFVGDGPEKPALQRIAADATAANVHFLPFANQTEMPARYLMADVYALPSRGLYETWGLAVNEAMHMGVPALVSSRVGCQQDLVTDGETGWVFDAARPESLRVKLTAALEAVRDPKLRSELRERIRARISGYTYAATTAGLLRALPFATRSLKA